MKTMLLALLLAAVLLGMVGCPKQLPIKAVILSDDNGTNKAVITLGQIDTWVDAANEIYSGHNIEFTFDHSDIVNVKSTRLNSVPVVPKGWKPNPILGIFYNEQQLYDKAANAIAAKYPDKIVILFRNNGGGGWSWGPPDLRYISMPCYTHTAINKPVPNSPNDTLLAHELGHYLGLAHTFNDVACNKVTLSNTDGDADGQDAGAADDIGDTNPDPGDVCAPTTNLNCASGAVTVNGIVFNPPWTNIMTYHDCLPETISFNQVQAINLTLQDPIRSAIPK